MDRIRARALFAVAAFYTTARENLDLPACNIYADAAEHIAPGIMAIGVGRTLSDITTLQRRAGLRRPVEIRRKPVGEPNTLAGLGLATVAVKL